MNKNTTRARVTIATLVLVLTTAGAPARADYLSFEQGKALVAQLTPQCQGELNAYLAVGLNNPALQRGATQASIRNSLEASMAGNYTSTDLATYDRLIEESQRLYSQSQPGSWVAALNKYQLCMRTARRGQLAGGASGSAASTSTTPAVRPPGGSSVATPSPRPAPVVSIPDFGGDTCEAALTRQNTGFENSTQPTTTITRYQYVLAYLQGRVGIMDRLCKETPGFAESRAGLQTSLDATLRACRASMADDSVCVASTP